MSLKIIKLNEGLKGLMVVIKLANGDEWYMEGHDGGISLITKNQSEKLIEVEKFSPTAIVVKQK